MNRDVIGRALLAAMIMGLAFGCGARSKQVRELTKTNLDTIQLNLEACQARHESAQERAEYLRSRLEDAHAELDGAGQSAVLAGLAVSGYREAMFGNGKDKGLWDLTHRSRAPYLFLLLGLAAAGAVFLKSRERGRESAASAEVNRVIERLNREKTPEPAPPSPEKPEPPPSAGPAAKPASALAHRAETLPATQGPKEISLRQPDPAPVVKAVPETPREKPTPEPVRPAPPQPAVSPPGPEAAKAGKNPAPQAAPGKKKKPETGKAAAKAPADSKKAPRRPAAKKCRVKGCRGKHRSKGLCNKHYQQWRKGILTEELEEE